MQIVNTSNPNYYILVDKFPYTDTREKIKTEFSAWLDYKKQRNQDIGNYLLDTNDGNSLEVSLQHRLNDGNFSFLYYKNICLCFAGLQIRDKNAWIHRLHTNPFEYINYLGTISQYLIPYHITTARAQGCLYYKLTYTGRNTRFYYFYKNKKFNKSKFYKSDRLDGVENISRYEFVGEEIINQTPQLVARLDLNRPDIDEFCKF